MQSPEELACEKIGKLLTGCGKLSRVCISTIQRLFKATLIR